MLQKGVQVTGQGPLWVGLALGAGVAAAKQHSWETVVLRGKQTGLAECANIDSFHAVPGTCGL